MLGRVIFFLAVLSFCSDARRCTCAENKAHRELGSQLPRSEVRCTSVYPACKNNADENKKRAEALKRLRARKAQEKAAADRNRKQEQDRKRKQEQERKRRQQQQQQQKAAADRKRKQEQDRRRQQKVADDKRKKQEQDRRKQQQQQKAAADRKRKQEQDRRSAQDKRMKQEQDRRKQQAQDKRKKEGQERKRRKSQQNKAGKPQTDAQRRANAQRRSRERMESKKREKKEKKGKTKDTKKDDKKKKEWERKEKERKDKKNVTKKDDKKKKEKERKDKERKDKDKKKDDKKKKEDDKKKDKDKKEKDKKIDPEAILNDVQIAFDENAERCDRIRAGLRLVSSTSPAAAKHAGKAKGVIRGIGSAAQKANDALNLICKLSSSEVSGMEKLGAVVAAALGVDQADLDTLANDKIWWCERFAAAMRIVKSASEKVAPGSKNKALAFVQNYASKISAYCTITDPDSTALQRAGAGLELLSSLKGPLGTAAAFTKRLSDLAQQLKSGTVTMDTVKNFLVETGAGALEAMGFPGAADAVKATNELVEKTRQNVLNAEQGTHLVGRIAQGIAATITQLALPGFGSGLIKAAYWFQNALSAAGWLKGTCMADEGGNVSIVGGGANCIREAAGAAWDKAKDFGCRLNPWC